MGKKTSLKEKAERAFEEVEKKKREAARVFNIDDVIRGSDTIREVYVEELNCVVRYKPLTFADLPEIAKATNEQERGILILYKLLSKADPNVTLEKVKMLPVNIGNAILRRIEQETRPLVSNL